MTNEQKRPEKNEFTLNGGVEEKDGKWNAVVLLRTPDGAESRLESGHVYGSQAEAEKVMEDKLAEVLADFRKRGVEVLARNGVAYA